MASDKSNLRPIYRSANKLKHNIEYYVNEKVAKKLKEMNMSLSDIEKATGLTVEEIESL